MIEYSAKRKGRARDEKVDIKQMAVAELMAWGWDTRDAMLVVGLLDENMDRDAALRATITYSSSEALTKLAKKRQSQLRNGAVLDEYQKLHPTPGTPSANRGAKKAEVTEDSRKGWEKSTAPVSDEEILSKMWDTITKLEPNDPKRVDLLDKYDKLKRRQNVGDDDNTIHFYLPRPECDTCPFRGNQIITQPEKVEPVLAEEARMEAERQRALEEARLKEEEERLEKERANSVDARAPKDWEMDDGTGHYVPKPGYSIYGKKIGRPPKRRRKKAEPKEQV